MVRVCRTHSGHTALRVRFYSGIRKVFSLWASVWPAPRLSVSRMSASARRVAHQLWTCVIMQRESTPVLARSATARLGQARDVYRPAWLKSRVCKVLSARGVPQPFSSSSSS